MIKLVFLIIVQLFLSLVVQAATSADPDWLVRVTSEFVDEENHSTLRVEGSGSIVAIDKTCLVLTASHVSEGSDLRIYSRDKLLELAIEKKIVDVDNDVALIPLRNCDVKPLAYWVSDYAATHVGFFVIPKSITKLWMEKCQFLCPTPINLVQVSGGGSLVPKGSWVKLATSDWIWKPVNDNKLFLENTFQKVHGGAHLNIDDLEATTTGKIVPGMSGAPHIAKAPKYGAVLHVGGQGGTYNYQVGSATNPEAELGLIIGVGNRFLRYFDRSFFSSPNVIMNLVDTYLGFRSRKTDDSSWKLRNCLQYRESSAGILEINPLSNPTGNGISGGPGNGISGGPGNGISGGPGSNSCSSEQKFGTSSILDSWKVWQISYGLGSRNGNGLIAYQLTPKSPMIGFTTEYIEANWSSYRLKNSTAEKYHVKEIRVDENLWSLFKSRFMDRNRYVGLGIEKSQECQLKIGKTIYGNSIDVKIQIPMENFSGRREVIVFRLDEYGRDISSRALHYMPIIEAKDHTGASYTIDVRGLFYTDRTMLTKNSLLGPAEYIWREVIDPSLYIKRAGVLDVALFCTYEP